jgi:hypothetical protein
MGVLLQPNVFDYSSLGLRRIGKDLTSSCRTRRICSVIGPIISSPAGTYTLAFSYARTASERRPRWSPACRGRVGPSWQDHQQHCRGEPRNGSKDKAPMEASSCFVDCAHRVWPDKPSHFPHRVDERKSGGCGDAR